MFIKAPSCCAGGAFGYKTGMLLHLLYEKNISTGKYCKFLPCLLPELIYFQPRMNWKQFSACLFAGGYAITCQAQLNWQNVDSLFQPLPASVHIFRSVTPIDGKPNVSYYLEAKLKSPELEFTTQTGRGKRYTPAEYYKKDNQPLVVVNGTFFSFADNRNLNMVMRQGVMQAYNVPTIRDKKDTTKFHYISGSAIGINAKREADVAWLFTDTATRYPFSLLNGPLVAKGNNPDPEWPEVKRQIKGGGRKKVKWKMETAIGGGPVLLSQGNVYITNNEEYKFVKGEADRHPRTAMGYTKDGRLIILMVEGRNAGIAEGATLQHEAEIMRALGCWEALNLDGGGSSCMLVNGKETIWPSDKGAERPVPGVFMIYHHE